MASKYTTKINMNDGRRKGAPGKRKQISRLEMAARNSPRARFAALKKYRLSKSTRQKLKKIALLCLGLFLVVGILGGIWFFSYLQKLNDELPPVENPFQDKELTSVIYDRNGTQLYKMFNQFNRDPVDITQIPERVQWAFLSAEDIDFYTHSGFDPAAIIRCGLYYITRHNGTTCGGSTITQQLVKITTDQSAPTLERKIRELLFSVKIEQAYTKSQILQMYLTVAPFGSTIYGITTAAQFYFGKTPKDLTLAEAADLASMIQDPVRLSPTIGSDTNANQARLKERQMYVLGQMQTYKDKINNQTRTNEDNPELEDVVTDEMITAAKTEDVKYRAPIFTGKKAGNFVDYTLEQLQTGNYNGGEPFTLSQLQTGGYKVYTSLDYDLQQIAEQSVADAVNTYGPVYDFSNAALITTQPSTGEIITMVGSKNYYGTSEGCDAQGKNCLFDPQVNVLANPRSPGSSTKPFGTYEAYKEGKLFSGSVLPDVPIDVGGGYTVKNWNGTYMGVGPQTTAGDMLRISRNLPALVVLKVIGIPTFLQTLRSFGYTTFADDSQFGPSVILGGSGVIGIEHAQAYGVFANGGNLVRTQVITKIVDRTGKTIYEYTPQPTKVADERAVYMLNETLLNNHALSWDGRDVSVKSGTSENSTDAWIAAYSPDFVSIAWVGNNNSQHMSLNAFGENAVAPWIKDYMRQIGDSPYFAAATQFPRPAGITQGGGCTSNCLGSYQGLASGYMMDDVSVPSDVTYSKIQVCDDQPDRLARPVDVATGHAKDAVAVYYKMAAPEYQGFLDNYMYDQATQGKGMPNGGPRDYCDKDRSGGTSTSQNPFFSALTFTITATGNNFKVHAAGNAFTPLPNQGVKQVDFYFDATGANANHLIGSVTLSSGSSFNLDMPDSQGVMNQYAGDNGTYIITAVATDTQGRVGMQGKTVTLTPATSDVTLTGASTVVHGVAQTYTFTYSGFVSSGFSLSSVTLHVKNSANVVTDTVFSPPTTAGTTTVNFTFPVAGTYTVWATAGKGSTGTLITATITVTAT